MLPNTHVRVSIHACLTVSPENLNHYKFVITTADVIFHSYHKEQICIAL